MTDIAADPPKIAISRSSTGSNPGRISASREADRRSPPRIDTVGEVVSSFRNKNKKTASWKQKQHSTDLRWHKKWTRNSFGNGRTLLIDYISNECTPAPGLSSSGDRHYVAVAAQEFEDLRELEAFYHDPRRANQAALRVIHVQNAAWATRFLLKKFNIDNDSELVGMEGFSRWARYERPRLRNGRPFPNGRSWRVQMDPWRNITRTAIGVDYMKTYQTPAPDRRRRWAEPTGTHLMHLGAYDDSRTPQGHDVAIQRFSVYVQRNLGSTNEVSPEDEFKVPYARRTAGVDTNGNPAASKWKDDKIEVGSLDNSNTIIVFESSASMHLEDCLVQPRNEFEKRWRRLSFYLKKEDAAEDARVAALCSNIILNDIFHGLTVIWEGFLTKASEHVALLEDRIYENPADESRAPELWTNQAAWLKVDKVMYLHRDILAELQGHLKEMTEGEERQEDWLAASAKEYDKLAHTIQEDLVQPTNNLSDLMYKSVAIRDSRQSLELGLAMWRLSWITFIFLPLTFIVGFFSMSVDILEVPVSVGWYFLAAVLLLLTVIFLWYGIKSSLQQRSQTAYQRGVYERLYSELEDEYPLLWSERGALDNVRPEGFWQKQKWRLIKMWFDPQRTVDRQLGDFIDADAGLGRWAKIKRFLLRQWLGQISGKAADIESRIADTRRSSFASSPQHGEAGVVVELAKFTTPVLIAEAEPEAAIQRIDTYGLTPLGVPRRRSSSSVGARRSDERPGSGGSSGIMIEERNLSDSESEIVGPAEAGAERE